MPSELYHFSENPGIARFEPHVARTADSREPRVWTVDADHADLYFFPRDCPRVTFHVTPATTAVDRERFFGGSSARRIAAIEEAWLPVLRATTMFRYAFATDGFELMDPTAGYWVSRHAAAPVRVEPVGDLETALARAAVDLRVLSSLWELYEAVIASSLGFSIIRWHNAAPRDRAGEAGPGSTRAH